MHRRRLAGTSSLATLVLCLMSSILVSPILVAPAAGGPTTPTTPTTPPAADPGPEPGAWTVEPSGAGSWQVSWRAPERLPVTSDRPTIVPSHAGAAQAAGLAVGVPTVADDGRTVAATVVSPQAPEPAELDVVLSGRALDEPVDGAPAAGAARWFEPEREPLPFDPAEPGDLQVTSEDYTLPGLELPGMTEEVEMVGHVVKPAVAVASTGHPLVVLLHGRHGYCYNPAKQQLTYAWPCRGAQRPVPSQLGYDYVQRTLASQGFVTVSVAANGINAQDGELRDGGAAARSALVQAHLDRWAGWAADGTHAVDLSKVVLVGHSRGGEGVARAALEIPLTAPYRVVGQVLLAPTDFARHTTPYVPTVTVLPYCDGDVSDLQGQAYTDLSRDLTTDDTSLHSSVMVLGANHNFFNTEWTPGSSTAPSEDDWWATKGACGLESPTRLPAPEQRSVGQAYVAGAVRLFASGDDRFRPMYDGSAVRVRSTGDAVVLSHTLGGGRELRRPGIGTRLTTPSGAVTQLCRGVTGDDRARWQCGRFAESPADNPHWPSTKPQTPAQQAFEMSWERSGAVGGLSFETPLDLSEAASLDLRTVVDNKRGDVALRLRLTDVDGNRATVAPDGGGALPALPRGPRWFLGKHWAQTLRLDPTRVSGVDLSRVDSLELVSAGSRGRVWVLDLAAAPPTLPGVPARRVPLVDLGSVRVEEGDEGDQVAEIPFQVTGALTRPAWFRVYATDYFDGRERAIDVDVPPGSTAGTVRWDYTGNALDSRRRIVHDLTGHGIGNVVVRDHEGTVVILDDDPSPQITFRRLARSAAEGASARWRVRLSEPVDYETDIQLRLRRGDVTAAPVRADDVGQGWLRRWSWVEVGRNPALHRTDTGFSKVLAPGRRWLDFAVPIRQDSRLEGRESITMLAHARDLGRRSGPVTVFVRRGR
jgi:hypothetical protein